MNELVNAIREHKAVRLVAYSVSPAIEDKVKEILLLLLEPFHCEELRNSLYTAIKELLINAVKANYKSIYFENYSPKNSASSMINYTTALELFKLELAREEGNYLAQIAMKSNINAEIIWKLDGDMLHVLIANPVTMTDIEMSMVQKKLTFARGCTDISEYFIEEEEDPNAEGAGLGLILVIMILKSLGGGEELFSIRSHNGKTIASISIPLTMKTLEQYRMHIAR